MVISFNVNKKAPIQISIGALFMKLFPNYNFYNIFVVYILLICASNVLNHKTFLKFNYPNFKATQMKTRISLLATVILVVTTLMAFSPTNNNFRSLKKRANQRTHILSNNYNPYYIIVSKKDYELKVFDEEGWYATYPIVFGSKDLGDKMREGDRRTPTGSFKIIIKKINKKWGAELLLDYPNEESYRRFKERKAKGLVPKNARIGDGIAIHATRKEEEWTVDNFYNWTDGCVSVKYSEMQDLYSYIPVGTPVTIKP
jgi:murein L,D-transpeptidase YafK